MKACAIATCLRYCETGGSRCPTHAAQINKPRAARKRAQRAAAPGDGASARARTDLTTTEAITCRICSTTYYTNTIEVDHIVPLADGGADIDTNIQLLCRGCHKEKTRREARTRAMRRRTR